MRKKQKQQLTARSTSWHRVSVWLLRAGGALVTVGILALMLLIVQDQLAGEMKAVAEPPRTLVRQDSPLKHLSIDSLETTLTGWYLSSRAADLDARPSTSSATVPFHIERGETARQVVERLHNIGLVKDTKLFELYLRYYGLSSKIEAGNFTLRRNMTIPELARALQRGEVQQVSVTIKEGWRMEETAAAFAKEANINNQDFLNLAAHPQLLPPELRTRYAFLQTLSGQSTLEGYLFPETYKVAVGSEPLAVIKRMLATFDARVTPQMRMAAAQRRRSLHDVVIIASIVEREAQRADERPLIASVYWNRVDGFCPETGGYLQADPTVQYAKGKPGDWWWKPPSIEAYSSVQSPYNTYLHPGLPPGPICSPGLSAIVAAIQPAATQYCFFVARGDGSHVFAVTLAEQQKNIQRYQGK